MPDLDQSGFAYQRIRVYLGPSLGWVTEQVRFAINITVGGTVPVPPGCGLVLVSAAASVTLNLPSVMPWIQESFYRPATAFDRGIWVKDLGGHAGSFNIVIAPFGPDSIDTSTSSVAITTNFGILRFYPLPDGSGWFLG